MRTEPASTHLTCNRCGKILHRENFRPRHRTCKRCQVDDQVAGLRARRRSDPDLQARERAWNQARQARLRAERRADRRWRQDWAQRTVVTLLDAGWTSKDLASASGVSVRTLRRWRRGSGACIHVAPFNRFWRWVGDLRWEQERGGTS